MTLPVSSYEELLNRVRSLTQETRQLQRQLDSPLLDQNDNNENLTNNWDSSSNTFHNISARTMAMHASVPHQLPDPNVLNNGGGAVLARLLNWPNKEEVTAPEAKEQDERKTSPETPIAMIPDAQTHKWAPTEFNLWHSVGPATNNHTSEEISMGPRSYSQHQLGAKVEMVYSLLSMLGTQNRDEMTHTLLAMSSSPESCLAMRQSGCLPLLVQLVHGGQESKAVRKCASQALHNLVHCHIDDKRGRREARVLRLIEQIQEYCANITSPQEDPTPCVAIAALMKLSFDEEHRHAMCQLGALQAIATLIQMDNEAHGSDSANARCITVRRYAGMALTNLTFGDCNNKAMLCSMRGFLTALVAQLQSPSEDLRQVTASVLRNLSWRADTHSKQALRQVGACTALMLTAMEVKKESTMKSILSALWNLSAHCNMNKADICAVKGALQYLVEMLRFLDAPSKTLAIVENAGGILRNISSHIAVREDYREILREHNCIPLLLQQLKSASLTVVSNACGTLWNLSARSVVDQRTLWELGAVPMLRSLVHSKHKMISMGSSAALKNLLAARPDADILDRASRGLPTLLVRKRRALEQELDSTLAETCDNIEPVERWDSHESVTSTHSENLFDRSKSNSHHSGSLQLAPPRRMKEVEEKPQPEALMERLTLEEPTNFSLKYTDQETPPISDQTEQPVNYSLKYSEEEKPEVDESEEVIQNYAETDLDQPTDYSLKYREVGVHADAEPTARFYHNNDVQTTNSQTENTVYAETDLDQPTDYSLRYAEEEPEKPQTYCTEGTPYNFSTATSLSDLRTPDTNNKSLEGKSGGVSPVNSLTNVPTPSQVKEETREGKVVTFETPLMFSRCSSLGSLSSCEPPDDRSSVVSEFSRMTSGMVSPSELPDSPTQTAPTSPHSVKPPVPIPGVKPVSVFEERVSVFKEENTPIQFSTATSLSDLTFDDDHPMEPVNKFNPTVELPPVDDKEDEDMLAACINIGMQHNNRRNAAKASPVVRCPPNQRVRSSGIPIKATPTKPQHMPDSEVLGDSTTVFRTEDTPANISHATSHSDLSNLCALSDDSDHDNILAECIQSGMPQARLTPSSSLKKTAKVATVLPMPIKPSLQLQTQSPPSKNVPTSTPRIKPDSTQEPFLDCIIEATSKIDRCRLISPVPDDGSSPLSSLEPDVEEAVTVLSRQPSVGSLSGEWTEDQEQVLLEQCITSGMPKTKNGINPSVGATATLADVDEKCAESSGCDIMRESDTWNDETSPSFPSISLTAPLITSYKSLEEDPIKPNINYDARIIELESGKVGIISNLELESSLELEAVRPPSCMGSLLSLTANSVTRSLLARRAAHHSDNSLSWHNLESIKPPSGMDEVMELENSILSCASLTSEVADSPANSVTEDTEQPTSITPHLTPKMKRQMLKDRYNTYTITGDKSSRDSSLDADINMESEVAEVPTDSVETSTPAKPKRITPKEKRLADKERFRTRTLKDQQIPVPLSPREKRLVDKDRFKTQTLDGPVIISSDIQLEIPDSTVILQESTVTEEETASQENESDSEKCMYNEESKSDEDRPKPIVVKPAEIKSVRGRKKARSHIPVVNRSPVTKSQSPKPPAPLQRQGTFTKDDSQTLPVTSGIPVFSNVKKQSLVKSSLPKKSTNSPITASNTSQVKKVTSVGRGRAGSLPRSEPPQKASVVRSSKSNQSLKSETLGSNTSLSSGGAHWNSNSSLNGPGGKKEATSKIASLWKRVEDSKKKKEAEGKDKRVWIGPNSTPPHSKQAV